MYSFKEKSRILKELLNPAFGESDLSLLRRLSPEENGGDSVVEVTETSGEQRTSPKAGEKKSSRKSKSTRISGGKGSVKTKTSK